MRFKSENDVFEYIFDLSSATLENTLGIFSREEDLLEFDHIKVKQSKTLLYQHSTGAMVWKTTPKFADWIRTSPINHLVESKTIVELGSGTGALAMLISDFSHKFIATDQKTLLKLCKQNCEGFSHVFVREFDWETQEFNDEDIYINDPPVTVLACDTIYNDYLPRPFLEAIFSVWNACSGSNYAIIGVQLRDLSVIDNAFNLFLRFFTEFEVLNISPGFIAVLLDRNFKK